MDKIVKQAIAEADATAGDFEQWRARRAQQEVIRRDYAPLEVSQPIEPKSQSQATFSAEASEPWNKWANALIMAKLGDYSEVIGEFTAEYVGEQQKKMRDWTHKQIMVTAFETFKRQTADLVARLVMLEAEVRELKAKQKKAKTNAS
jgi:hypothetical protein